MDSKQFLDSLSQKINQLLPRAGELGEESREAIRQLLQRSFSELNILSREDFESRERALRRAEERVTALEHQIGELERQLSQSKSN